MMGDNGEEVDAEVLALTAGLDDALPFPVLKRAAFPAKGRFQEDRLIWRCSSCWDSNFPNRPLQPLQLPSAEPIAQTQAQSLMLDANVQSNGTASAPDPVRGPPALLQLMGLLAVLAALLAVWVRRRARAPSSTARRTLSLQKLQYTPPCTPPSSLDAFFRPTEEEDEEVLSLWQIYDKRPLSPEPLSNPLRGTPEAEEEEEVRERRCSSPPLDLTCIYRTSQGVEGDAEDDEGVFEEVPDEQNPLRASEEVAMVTPRRLFPRMDEEEDEEVHSPLHPSVLPSQQRPRSLKEIKADFVLRALPADSPLRTPSGVPLLTGDRSIPRTAPLAPLPLSLPLSAHTPKVVPIRSSLIPRTPEGVRAAKSMSAVDYAEHAERMLFPRTPEGVQVQVHTPSSAAQSSVARLRSYYAKIAYASSSPTSPSSRLLKRFSSDVHAHVHRPAAEEVRGTDMDDTSSVCTSNSAHSLATLFNSKR